MTVAETQVPDRPPCVVWEDEDLLVVNKPPGWNTHAPAPFAGEGIHDWLKHREPRWARLAIVHRLDKDTSGLMVFGKTPEANRSLTDQFARRQVDKHYVLVTDRLVRRESFTVLSDIVRVGDRYLARPVGQGGDRAETHFRVLRREGARTWVHVEPVTGRTHQIRVHASSEGFPILGDPLYDGTPSRRLHLHAAALSFRHPRTQAPLEFQQEPDFVTPASDQLRRAFLSPEATTAFRRRQGAADGTPGWYEDQLGEWRLCWGEEWSPEQLEPEAAVRGTYFKPWLRQVRSTPAAEASPRAVAGETAPDRFTVRENGVNYELSLKEGYSVGLFFDQRDNRRRFLTRHVASGFPLYRPEESQPEVLNCFAYTCGFSVCAALGGARATSLDLSRKYLDWGRLNFQANGLDPNAHDFIYGDVFDWLKRLAKKPRRFSVIILDPPTFSRSREHGDFRAESDYGHLVSLTLPLLAPQGVLLASSNAARLLPERFCGDVRAAVEGAGRRVVQDHYVPQPPDFPISREEPAYLKTFWVRVS